MQSTNHEPPRIVSFDELTRKLWPYIGGWPWAVKELHDLWRMGAPLPNQILLPGQEGREKRILLPTQFAKWWQEVAGRHAIDLSAREVLRA
jgi:hypothetical protein